MLITSGKSGYPIHSKIQPNDRIKASMKLKNLILSLNEIYKQEKDPFIMDIMKRLTILKRKAESRLKLRITS